jgi:catechol 2,3-dioxygenase-like lactoylglutathione lyase family enzyme
MPISALDHYNVVTSDLEITRRFYREVVGLHDGERPPFGRAGAWMYLDGHPILHISTGRAPTSRKSDAYDHVAFRAYDLKGTRALLREKGVHFQEFGVPDRNMHQVFFRDPDGAEIELIFSGAEARTAAEAGAAVDASMGRNT